MKTCLKIVITAILCSTCTLSYAASWQNLWERPDQQGVKALQQGKPNDAAQLFKNEQWKGVANYRAGEYNKAAEEFSKSHTEKSYYNQANSQAYMGDYQAAIKAYDEALQLNPNNEDAQHNLEIVEKLLEQQKKQQSKQQKDQQSKGDKQKQNQEQQSQSQQSQQKQHLPC